MNCLPRVLLAGATALLTFSAQAKVITVTTTNSDNPPAGTVSLKQAITDLQDGDEIRFNLPGSGPFFLPTPAGGYPAITKNRVTINGYSQPGASPNTSPILAANNAKIQIVLDSRQGNFTSMNFWPDNGRAGYGDTEFAILGVVRATNVTISGLSLLGVAPAFDNAGTLVSDYAIAFGCDDAGTPSGGHVSGCWIGVAPDGKTLAGHTYSITGFRWRDPDGQNPVLMDNITIGVAKKSTNAPAEFNVIVQSAIPVIIEGNNTRISGNFIGVLPDGVTEYNVALAQNESGELIYTQDYQYEGAIEIGRGGNNTLIGTDGDGVNDANERNVIVGTLPPSMNGYDHTIEFYGNAPGTNIVIAGNYIGVGIDGSTYFTNGAPAINASSGSAQYRIGSNVDGVSDDVEGNVIANHWPISMFPATPTFTDLLPDGLNFFDEISKGSIISLRGNSLINDFPYPVSPTKTDGGEAGAWVTNYYAPALVDATMGITPMIDASSTTARLKGKVPVAIAEYSKTYVDLYLLDQVGHTNGMAASIPELPHGFIQGSKFLGSVQVDGASDLNPKAGEFEVDIRSLGVAATNITITANYAKSPVGTDAAVVLTSPFSAPVLLQQSTEVDPPTLSIALSGSTVTISWEKSATGFTLQAKEKLSDATWTDVGSTNPTVVTAGTGSKFYRLRN